MAGRRAVIRRALARARSGLAELGVRVTADQLYYETCRVLLPLHRGPRRPAFLVPRPVRRSAFDRALAASDGPPLVGASLPDLAGATDAPDLLDYGLPRLLVCQHDGIAAMLLANDLHMESATAVLGGSQVQDGLPPLLEAAARERATIHLLHDATDAGAAWQTAVAGRLAGGPLRVVTPGLRPAQARALRLHRGPSGGAELVAVPPAHLLRVLRRLLAAPRTALPPTSLRARADLGFLSWPGEHP